jgi:hypothetical protein
MIADVKARGIPEHGLFSLDSNACNLAEMMTFYMQ